MCISGGRYLKTLHDKTIKAWRAWEFTSGGVLKGTFIHGSRWMTKRKKTRDPIYFTADSGLHSLATRRLVNRRYARRVFGEVKLSGQIAVFVALEKGGSKVGYLSAHQEILKLYIPRLIPYRVYRTQRGRAKLASMLRKRYKVPVVLM